MPQPRMFTCSSRPGSQPSHGARPANISSESLVRKRISPIQTKSGSDASVHEALAAQNDWKRLTSGGELLKNWKPTYATTVMAIAIHNPVARSTKSRAMRIVATTSVVMSQAIAEVGLRVPKIFRFLVGSLAAGEMPHQFVDYGDQEY